MAGPVTWFCVYQFSPSLAAKEQQALDDSLLQGVFYRVLLKTVLSRPMDAFHGACLPLPTEGIPISGVDLSGQGSGLSKRRRLSCYYGFVPAAERSEPPPADATAADAAGGDARNSLVCFVVESFDAEDLELFVSDMNALCSQMQPHLTARNALAVSELASPWWSICIGYFAQCVLLAGSGLASLLHAAVTGSALVVDADPLVRDRILRLAQSAVFAGDAMSVAADALSAHVHVAESVTVSPANSNAFCEAWATDLLRAASAGPVRARRTMEQYRQQVVKDVNDVRRLLSDGRHDFYALHRAFVCLRDSINRDVLLTLIGKVATDASLDDLMDVVQAKLAETPPPQQLPSADTASGASVLASPAHNRVTPYSTSAPLPMALPSPPMSPRI